MYFQDYKTCTYNTWNYVILCRGGSNRFNESLNCFCSYPLIGLIKKTFEVLTYAPTVIK
uniref:Uncharacterized protein n=1 Tax=Arundo donax TaxID=35708 RepID=A0A0A9AXC5_ARUDO